MTPSAENDLNKTSKKKYPGFWKNLVHYIYEYSDFSTITGMIFLGEKGRSIIERIFWFIVLTISLYFCINMIIETYEKWENSPVIVSFAKRPKPVWEIPFPSITVCPEIKSERKFFSYTQAYFDYKNGNNITDELLEQLNKMSLVCNDQFYNEGSEYVEDDIVEYLDKVAPKFNDIWYQCKSLNTNVTCQALGQAILTEEGKCHALNMFNKKDIFTDNVKIASFSNDSDNSLTPDWSLEEGYQDNDNTEVYPNRALAAGYQGSLTAVLKIVEKDLDYICSGAVQGYKIHIHNPAEYPKLNQKYFRVPIDQDVVVTITPEMMTTSDDLRSYKPHKRQCYYSDERQLKFFKVYTQQNCEIECSTLYTLQTCGCVAFYMPRSNDTLICGPKKIKCMREAQISLLMNEADYDLSEHKNYVNRASCDCLPSCTSLTYNYELTQANYNWSLVIRDFLVDDKELKGIQLMRLVVYFKEQQFINSERNELYGPVDFFANFGGLLGLFIGISAISAAEIVYFLSLRIISNIRKYGIHFWSGSQDLIETYSDDK